MKNVQRAELIDASSIQVPEKYRRRSERVEDDKLRQSIQRTGIQQPLVVSRIGDNRYVLIDGCRRLAVAKYLKFASVPCVIDEAPDDVPAEEYRDRIRFILDEHRQDLFPSQRAALIKTLMKNFKMNMKQVGNYLGVNANTIANWLIVDSYIPDVVQAIDGGEITQHAARVFAGMTPKGQKHVWESHKEDLKTLAPSKLHRQDREEFHPTQHPNFYEKPEIVVRKLNRPHRKRTSARRPVMSKTEKEMFLNDIEMREAELKDAETELAQFKLEISLAARIIRAIRQNGKLCKLVPANIREEFDRFAEVYI